MSPQCLISFIGNSRAGKSNPQGPKGEWWLLRPGVVGIECKAV